MSETAVGVALAGLGGLVCLGIAIDGACRWVRRVYLAVLLVRDIDDASAAVARITRSAHRRLQLATSGRRNLP